LNNITIPSGGDATVAAGGGYLQGGGHRLSDTTPFSAHEH
jgi:hypothetical protein